MSDAGRRGFFISGARRARAARARPQARNASESGDDSDGRQGRTASLDPRGLQPPAPLSGRPRVVGPPHRADRGHRRPEPGPVARGVGVDTVFGIPGGAILPAYDPLMDSTKVRHILVRHEQGAGHAAEGYASATGKVGVCMATSGPGRHEPGHADRRRLHGLGADGGDHRPGRVGRRSARTPSRRPTSAASRCRSPSTTTWSPTPTTSRGRSPRRSTSPRTGRPGPVLVDITKDALQATTTFDWPPKIDLPGYRPVTRPHGKQIREAARLIAEAQPPGAVRRRRRHPGRAPATSCAASSS